jgi:hypothetical protein
MGARFTVREAGIEDAPLICHEHMKWFLSELKKINAAWGQHLWSKKILHCPSGGRSESAPIKCPHILANSRLNLILGEKMFQEQCAGNPHPFVSERTPKFQRAGQFGLFRRSQLMRAPSNYASGTTTQRHRLCLYSVSAFV